MTLDKRLEDLLYDLGSTMFCLGQDWTKGDGSASQVDVIVDKTIAGVKPLIDEERSEKLRILASLAYMYGQYCDGPYGHDFMNAGEDAIEILEDYKLASEIKGVDYKAVEKLEVKIADLQRLQGEEKT